MITPGIDHDVQLSFDICEDSSIAPVNPMQCSSSKDGDVREEKLLCWVVGTEVTRLTGFGTLRTVAETDDDINETFNVQRSSIIL